MRVRLSKLHGAGNDFLVAVALDGRPAADAELARRLCDRHRGIGADGLLTLLPPSDGADCAMELRNADGSIAEMSGNGIRCLAWVAAREGVGSADRISVATAAGTRVVDLERNHRGDIVAATVDMGAVTFVPAEIPVAAEAPFDLEATFHGVTYVGDAVGVGNPHFVLRVDDVETARVTQHGPHLERDDRFPNRTNVEFATVTKPDTVELRIWERGVGETLSCGTGVVAAAAALHRRALVGPCVLVRVPGGTHRVELGETARLHGPVVHVFDVDINTEDLT